MTPAIRERGPSGVGPARPEDFPPARATHDQICDAWVSVFEQGVDRAAVADRRGDADARDWALDDAEHELAQAQPAGCEWATRVVPAARITAPPTGVHPAP